MDGSATDGMPSDEAPGLTPINGEIATSASTFAGSQQKLTRDSRGYLYLAYLKAVDGIQQLYVARSNDDGHSWSDFPQISEGPTRSSSPSMVINGDDTITVFWTKRIVVSPEERLQLEGQATVMIDGLESMPLELLPEDQSEAAHVHGEAEEFKKGVEEEEEEEEEIRQLFVSRFDGSAWTEQQQLTDGEYNGYSSGAYDSTGVLHLVWYGYDGLFYQIVYSSYRDGHWTTPTQISRGYPDSVNPTLVVDPSDNVHVAWYQFSPATRNYKVNYRSLSSGTGSWSKQLVVSRARESGRNVSMVAMGSDAVIVSYEGKDLDAELSGVYLREIRSGAAGDLITIAQPRMDALRPSLSLNVNGRIYLFFASQADGRIYLSRTTGADAAYFAGPVAISPGPSDQAPNARWTQYDPYGAAKGIDVVWTPLDAAADDPAGPNRIHFETVGPE